MEICQRIHLQVCQTMNLLYGMEHDVLVFLILISSAPSRSTIRTDSSLYLIHTISRHGDRTPVDTYPADPHINASFAPYGWGQLTKIGRTHQFELGRFLQKRYRKFWKENGCNRETIEVRSTDSARTKMSARLLLAGLLAENGSSHSIPVLYEPLNEDKLLLVRTPCPRYFQLRHSVIKLVEERHSLSHLYEYLTAKTGMKIETPDDVQSLYSTLRAEEDFKLKLPFWTRRVYPTVMYRVAVLSFVCNAYNEEMQKLKAGPFLDQLVNHYLRIVNGKESRRAFLYVGHDSTVANLLLGLGVWQEHIPPYNVIMIFELHKLSQDFAVRIMYKNTTAENAGIHSLKLPHCERLCPLRKFIDLTKNVRCDNLKRECVSDSWSSVAVETKSP